jgi:hypothetical protein
MHHMASPMRERLELLQPTDLADAIAKGERYAARINEDHKHEQLMSDKLTAIAKRLEAVEMVRANPPRPPTYNPPTRTMPKTNNAPPTCFFCKKSGHFRRNCPLITQFTRFVERVKEAEGDEDEIENAENDPDFQSESAD